MPMPLWFGQINKRFFNKMELKRGVRPVLTHVGRSSGTVYRTPLDAHPVDDGYLFILVYGPGSDWVKNVMAAGTAGLKVGDNELGLTSPRLVTKDVALQLMRGGTKTPPAFMKVTEFLQMDVSQ